MNFFKGFVDELLKLAGSIHNQIGNDTVPDGGVDAVELHPEGDSPLVHEWHTPDDVEERNMIQHEYHTHRMPDGGRQRRLGQFDAKKR